MLTAGKGMSLSEWVECPCGLTLRPWREVNIPPSTVVSSLSKQDAIESPLPRLALPRLGRSLHINAEPSTAPLALVAPVPGPYRTERHGIIADRIHHGWRRMKNAAINHRDITCNWVSDHH